MAQFTAMAWANAVKANKVSTIKAFGAKVPVAGIPKSFTVEGLATFVADSPVNLDVSLAKIDTDEDRSTSIKCKDTAPSAVAALIRGVMPTGDDCADADAIPANTRAQLEGLRIEAERQAEAEAEAEYQEAEAEAYAKAEAEAREERKQAGKDKRVAKAEAKRQADELANANEQTVQS